jgi:hypothetical protein
MLEEGSITGAALNMSANEAGRFLIEHLPRGTGTGIEDSFASLD